MEEGAKLGLWEFVLIDKEEIRIPPADYYILGAWHPVYEQLLSLNGKKVVLWTSSVGEMGFEPIEQEYLDRILKDPRIDFVWFGDKSLGEIYNNKGFYAPYPLDAKSIIKPDVKKENIITLFCPAGHKKNVLNQLYAIKLFQKEHPNAILRTNIPMENWNYLDIKYIQHPWLPRPEYEKLIASARVNMACSFAETYNYQCAEALLLGTISVISNTIPLPGFIANNPNSPLEIYEAMKQAHRVWHFCKSPNNIGSDYLRIQSVLKNQQLTSTLSHYLT